MSPLVYLTVCKAKNKLSELLHKPLKLIITIGFIVLMVMNFRLTQASSTAERPLYEFKAIIFAFYILCFVTESKKGFQSGGTMFSMADVNLLFMSPVKPVAVLFHGMLSRLGSSLFMGLAFIYQFTLLRSYYPINTVDMLAAVIGYGATVFISQLAGMLIYFYTCGNSEKIKKAKAVLYTVCGLFVIQCAVRLYGNAELSFTGVALAITSFEMRFFPVAGWIFTAAEGIMLSDSLKVLLGFAPCIAFSVAVFLLLAFSKHGYYEDVLLSAEKNSEKKADENAQPVTKIRRNAGKLKGSGASTLFYKHLIENRRTRAVILSPSSLFYLVLIGVYGFLFDGDFAVLFSLSCMISFIPVLGGRWLRELTMPHIYMIPASPVKKLFFILPEMLPKILAESVLQCAIIGYICRLGILTVILLIAARISVSFVLASSSLLIARIFREKEKNSVFLAMSVLPGMLFVIPSVAVLISVMNFGFGFVIGFALMALTNTGVSFLLLFLARNLLKITD